MVQPLVSQFWRSFVSNRSAPPPASAVQQILLNGGDRYYLDAGHYTVRVLTGSVWVPGIGIFAAGQTRSRNLHIWTTGCGLYCATHPPVKGINDSPIVSNIL